MSPTVDSPRIDMARFSTAPAVDLIVRLPNWVGDTCMCVPTLHSLRSAGFRVYLVGRAWVGDLLGGFRMPCTVVGRGIVGPARTIRKQRIRNGLLLATSFSTGASMWLAGARAIGLPTDYRRPLLFRAIEPSGGGHVVETFWKLGEAARDSFSPDAPWPIEPPADPLPLLAGDDEQARTVLVAAGIDRPFLLVCPLAVGTIDGRTKVWPGWRETTRALHGAGYRMVACPGPGEEEACSVAAPEAIQLAGLRLGVYAAICRRAAAVLSNDSGPGHMAAAVGAPTIGIMRARVGAGREHGFWRAENLVSPIESWPSIDEVLQLVEKLAPADRVASIV